MSGRIEIVAGARPESLLLRKDGMSQSEVDLADPTRLAFDYVRRMADVVDLAAPAGERLRVLHIGGGALTLPRYVAATRPGSSQIVLEPDAELTAAVRAAMPLERGSGIRVRPVDGRAGLTAVADASSDVVLLDAFADGRVPGDLVTAEAFGEIRRVLAPAGLLAVNLVEGAPFRHTRRVLAGMREHFAGLLVTADSAVLKGRVPGNVVVVAGATVPEAGLTGRVSGPGAPRVLGDATVRDMWGGAQPFAGADTEAGPVPSLP